jgi:hypothetical protein
MKVKDAYQVLGEIISEGWEELELIAVDGASGVSYEVCLYAGEPDEKNQWENAGILCDEENGYRYIGVGLD